VRLEVNGIHFSYGRRRTLSGISFTAGEGKVTSIIGPNGSGKTTLLKCITKILKPSQGVILLDGQDIAGMEYADLARRLSYVPQGTTVPFPLTVFDAVLLGRRPYIRWNVSQSDQEITARTLVLLGLEDLSFRYFNELSSGQKQKVILARALVQKPELLLLDEPPAIWISNISLKCWLFYLPWPEKKILQWS
jgi:iron complex transport system ATP-binding protein